MNDPLDLVPITTRKMLPNDLVEVVALDRLSFTLPWPESSFKYEVEQNQFARCWVAEVITGTGKLIAGMIVAWLIIDELHIATLAVHPDYRKKKIAHRLLTQVLLDGVNEHVKFVFLEVRSGNTTARRLYSSFGFAEEGIRKRYYKDNNEDAVLMTLDMTDLDKLEWPRWGKI